MIRVGVAGIGFMGWIHWLAYQKTDDIQVTAICSRDPAKRAGDWTSIQGNFGPPGEKIDLSSVKTYETFEEMCLDDSLDLIDICFPPSKHCQPAVAALNAGKHVFCEKPMALTVKQCDQMTEAAQQAKRHLLVGHVLPFFPEYAFVRKLVDEQTYGKLLGGEFKRTVSDPTWIKGFFDLDVAGGPLFDLNVHDAHFIRSIFGMPEQIVSTGRMRDECVEYCASLFKFADHDLVVSSHGGVINQQGRPFTHGFEVRFEKATVQFEFAAFADTAEAMPLKVLKEDGSVERPDLGDGDPVDAFVAEINEVKNVLLGNGNTSSVLEGQLARDAIQLCHAQAESVKNRKAVSL